MLFVSYTSPDGIVVGTTGMFYGRTRGEVAVFWNMLANKMVLKPVWQDGYSEHAKYTQLLWLSMCFSHQNYYFAEPYNWSQVSRRGVFGHWNISNSHNYSDNLILLPIDYVAEFKFEESTDWYLYCDFPIYTINTFYHRKGSLCTHSGRKYL